MSTSISAPQLVKVYTTFDEKGVTSDILQNQLLGTGLLADVAEAAALGTIPQDRDVRRKFLGLAPAEFKFVVDYSMTLPQMIAAGRYDWQNDDITPARFPVNGEGQKELNGQLVHFNRNMGSDDVKKELDAKGLRPATHEELLAFGATYPEMQRQFPIVALGSFAEIGGGRDVVCLDGDGSGRGLGLVWLGGGWGPGCRFLAVAK
jgi:hypothetical protein